MNLVSKRLRRQPIVQVRKGVLITLKQVMHIMRILNGKDNSWKELDILKPPPSYGLDYVLGQQAIRIARIELILRIPQIQ